jgi:hypothetical protein
VDKDGKAMVRTANSEVAIIASFQPGFMDSSFFGTGA